MAVFVALLVMLHFVAPHLHLHEHKILNICTTFSQIWCDLRGVKFDTQKFPHGGLYWPLSPPLATGLLLYAYPDSAACRHTNKMDEHIGFMDWINGLHI